MESIGPGGTTSFEITAAISDTLLLHTQYVSNLSLWFKFLIWRYTLGSGAINTSLIGIATEEQRVFWTYNFFRSFKYPAQYIDSLFVKYLEFFRDPSTFVNDPHREVVAGDVISSVTNQLEKIILGAPVNKDTFIVYKVSSKYPELPDRLDKVVDIVHQKPFNSTTYNPQFNFAPFIAEESTCCLHKIVIPPGSHTLLVPSEYHAYPFELECLLPFGCDLLVVDVSEERFNYIPREQQKFIPVQHVNNLRIGTVYVIDPLSGNKVITKKLKYYISELRS